MNNEFKPRLISIIIPALNEEANIGQTLASLPRQGDGFEVIVADGGSTDATAQIASEKARLVTAPRGRALQMNAGAWAASGDVLLFLHADTVLPTHALDDVRRLLQDERVAGGGFSLRFDDPAPSFRVIAFMSNLRAGLTGLIFGDQAIFVRRSIFERMGGFQEMALMEDWDFSLRMKKEGQVVISGLPVTSSARRFRRHGVWRTVWLMQWIKLLYLFGVSPERLRAIYERKP